MRTGIKFSLVILLSMLAVACGLGGGGGGGGSDSSGVEADQLPEIYLNAYPRDIDSGDRMTVDLQLDNVRSNTFVVKLRFKKSISYVYNSSFLLIDGDPVDTSPDVSTSDDTYSYLVYYMNIDQFLEHDSGQMVLQLEATANLGPTDIEADIDVDDPTIANSSEFDVTKPKFSALANDGVNIGGVADSSSSSSSSSASSSSSSAG